MFDAKKEAVKIIKEIPANYDLSAFDETVELVESSIIRAFNAGLEAGAEMTEAYTKPLFFKSEILDLMGMDTVIKLREIHRKEIAKEIRNIKKPERMKGV